MPRPPIFAPDATSADVQDYLTKFFMYMEFTLTVAEAQKRAREMEIDGKRAYNLPYKAWMEAYGLQGQEIYIELREANYRYVSPSLIIMRTVSLITFIIRTGALY